MQSFREQSSYHGSQQTYPPEAHGPSRIEEYSPRQQAQMFQGSYGGRRGATGTPTSVSPGENSSLQNYQTYRKDSGDFYYLGNKEGSAAGSQAAQRRSSGPVQNYGPPQGSNSSVSTGYSTHYGREGHHSQFSGQHSATASISQYPQDFPGSFSPGGGQYPSPVPTQQLRQQLFQSHHSISQSANTSTPTGTSHLQQMQRSAAVSSSVGYPLRIGQYGPHYQSSGGSSSTYPPQRFGQSGSNFECYSPGSTSTPYETHISGSSYGTQQQGFGSYSQHLKNFETTKIPQGGNQGQQNPHVMQFSSSSKLLPQSQAGQFNQTEVPVRSPMQFQQNFSPVSNPSPAASVVQSPGCSSTPSPLMTSGENLQCTQGSVQPPTRTRIMPILPQLSPNTQIGNYKGFGVEGHPEKRLTDPGLSSLSALSSQVANLPNTVQHMLLSDALAPDKKGSKRTSRKTDSCANSETSSQAEEQLKSPMTESLDGSCSGSSGDPSERVRQLSGQSTSSEAVYKGPPSEKQASPVRGWQNEVLEKTVDQEPTTVPEPAELFQEVPKQTEKSVGVIVSMETMTNRLEKVTDEVPKPVEVDSSVESNLSKTAVENDNSCSNNQNGESSVCDPVSALTLNVSQQESTRSPVSAGFGIKDASTDKKSTTSLPQSTKNSDSGNIGVQGDRKLGRSEKFPSLLQEVLQGHHQQEGRYARNLQESPAGMGNSEVVLRSNVLTSQAQLTSQATEQSTRNILGKNSAPYLEALHWGQWERKSAKEAKTINLDVPTARKFEAEVPASSHEPSSGTSERRSVICDISPLRQIVRDPSSSHHLGPTQERPPDGRSGQSVILPSGVLALEKSNCLGGIAKVEDESPKTHRRRSVEHCVPYSTKDSVRGSASPRSMIYDPNQDYSPHNSRTSNTKRGPGRVGSRGRSPAQTQDISEKLKMSPGRSRGPTEISHMNPTVSLSERANREALYSAFFQNAEASSLGYHTNSRSSAYGEPHPAFTSPLHYKRHLYQQEEYKEWLGSSAQTILSASQNRQEMQRKSQRQEPFHVCSPGRNENEGLSYSQPSSYHEPSNLDYSRPMRMNEGTQANMMNVDVIRNSQKTSGDSSSWHLGHQAAPSKKLGSPVVSNQPFSQNRDSEPHSSRSRESKELTPQSYSAHRSTGPEEATHHNPLIMRRRVRSFISPIPSKRQLSDDKGKSVSKDGPEKIPAAHVLLPTDGDTGFSAMSEESNKPLSAQRNPTAVSLSSPAKTKILPPRKGRGLKLEAIVQKITSPNIRRITTPCASEGSTEPVTLDDILSLKGKGPDGGTGSIQEITERTVNVLPSIPCIDEVKVKSLSPKSTDLWTSHDDKQIKKEIDEHSFDNKDLSQSSGIIQSSSNHFIHTRGDSPAFEPKCPLQQVQQSEMVVKEKIADGSCLTTHKQNVTPPKGYFPSGKKKGRPVGSVNKQKKQLQQQAPPSIASGLTSPLPAAPPPPQVRSVSEQGFVPEPKPKRRRRERRKAAGTTRRRRGRQNAPIVIPLEPEIKLKYASQTIDKTETKAKSFFPYIHVENKEELGLSCVIINAEDEEQRWKKLTSVRKGQRSTSPQPTESKALPVSSFMVQGPVVTESASVGHLVCCFCGKWANYKNLGDLFGPFYTQEYASTLSKNPPPKRSVETPKVKVRHKDGSDGSKTDSDEEDELQPAREQRSLPAHPRFKRRNRSGDCVSSRHAVPSRRKTTDSCELNSLEFSGISTADGVPDQGFQIPQLPLDSNEFWMHEGCVLWANGVYLVCGRLYGLQEAIDIAREINCAHCQEPGATLGCYNKGCVCCYHFPCAMDSECLLSEENFSVRCPKHKMKTFKSSAAEQPEQS